MTSPPHARYEELVAGHALSALEPEDEDLLLKHLPACATCEQELAAHRQTLAQLAHTAEQPAPPAALWDGIRRGVEASGRPASFSSTGGSVVLDLGAARTARRPALRRAARWTSLAAAVALVAGLAGWNVALHRDRAEQAVLATRATELLRAVEAAPARTVPLVDDGGRVTAVAVLRADRMSLVVDGLAPNDVASSTYVLWGARDDAVKALASFDVGDRQPEVVHDVALPAAVAPVPELLLITREPGRTAPEVTKQSPLATGRAA